ncbi:MAG: WxL domain-containing protein [Lactobacillales bacterium]|jgi:hypothetical protein|nr:WxL domain-containing protein [Lactobacillales bacterium]
MKKKVLLSTALLGALAASVAVPTLTLAAPTVLDGHGYIQYAEDNDPGTPEDPEDPEVPIDPPGTGPTGGALAIDSITNLNFNVIKNEAGQYVYANAGNADEKKQASTANKGTYYADKVVSPVIAKDENGNPHKDGSGAYYYVKAGNTNPIALADLATKATLAKADAEKVTGPNFVEVTDKRITDGKNGWILSAELTKQFTADATHSLVGASITYNNLLLNSSADTSLWPTLDGIGNSGYKLDLNTEKVFAKAGSATDTTKGFGTYTLAFGNTANYTAPAGQTSTGAIDSTNSSVVLDVPAGQTLTDKEYTADITWTLTSAF